MKSFREYLAEDEEKFSSAEELRNHYEKKYSGVSVDLFDHSSPNVHTAHLSMIHVPKEHQKKGIGSEIMRAISSYGDSSSRTISLSPERMKGGPGKAKLVSWYRSHGFVPNTGRNKDFTISASMHRRPKVK